MMPEIPNQAPSWRYTDIFEKHYASKASDQRKYLMEIAYQFLEPKAFLESKGLWEKVKSTIGMKNTDPYFPIDCGVHAVVSPFHLERLSRAYFIDIIRYKEYHYNPKDVGMPYEQYIEKIHSGDDKRRLGPDKIAAYLVKWIIKAQPIQVEIQEDANLKDSRINDLVWYVNSYFALFVISDLLKIPLSKLDLKMRMDLLHHIRFRPYDESSFVLLFRSVQDSKS